MTYLSEFRIAVRMLLKAKGFSSVVVTTLALAISLEVALFAVMNAYLVRTLPYPAGDRLYNVSYAEPGRQQPRDMEMLNWKSLSDIVEHPIAWDLDVFYLIGGDHPESAPGAWVTQDFTQGFGVRADIGRVFTPEEFETGSPQVALISHTLWQSRFGGDPAILGKSFNAYVSDRPEEAETFTIIGVLPADFWHVNPYTQVFAPLRVPSYPYIVRLRKGISSVSAEHRIGALVGSKVQLRSTHQVYVQTLKPVLAAVGVAGTTVSLIACANVVFLTLIRSNRRQKEVAIRLALGAGRASVARLLLAESLLLCLVATGIGVFLASVMLDSLGPAIQQQLGRPVPGGTPMLTIDASVIAATIILSAIIALSATLAPLAVSWRRSLLEMMRRGKQSGAEGVGGGHTRSALIAVEVAGSVALLIACALMTRTVIHLLDVDLGFRAGGLVSASLGLRERTYPDNRTRQAFYERLSAALNETPGIQSVALSSPSLLTTTMTQPLQADSLEGPVQTDAGVIMVTPTYFDTVGIRLVQGRGIGSTDRIGSEPVTVISQSLAKRLWPHQNPLGNAIRIADRESTVNRTVVGVVSDIRQSASDADLADMYIPLFQAAGRFASISLRANSASSSWNETLRDVLRQIDPEVTLTNVRDVRSMADDQLRRPRFLAALLTGFSLFALLLALIGVYGVIAYGVKQREHEIAVRIAIGADTRSVTRLFLRQGAMVLVVGIVCGILAGAAIGKMLEAQLFGVRPTDLWTAVSMAAVIAVAGVLAAWLPARRATKINPIIALRED